MKQDGERAGGNYDGTVEQLLDDEFTEHARALAATLEAAKEPDEVLDQDALDTVEKPDQIGDQLRRILRKLREGRYPNVSMGTKAPTEKDKRVTMKTYITDGFETHEERVRWARQTLHLADIECKNAEGLLLVRERDASRAWKELKRGGFRPDPTGRVYTEFRILEPARPRKKGKE